MLLHYAQNSRAVRVAWLLEELNLPYTIKKYKLGDKEMREERYKKLNPLGRVPTLEDDELIISESGAIIQYIISKYGNNQFIPEINTSFKNNSDFNSTYALRYSFEQDKSVDLYYSNAPGIQDIGQLLENKEFRFGIKLNFLY